MDVEEEEEENGGGMFCSVLCWLKRKTNAGVAVEGKGKKEEGVWG